METVSNELFLQGGGLMGERIRKKDWTKTPLGEPSEWPLNLKTCIRIILTSRLPMLVCWGTQLNVIYNDAYLSLTGDNQAESLGQPAMEFWKEIWDRIGPRLQTVVEQNTGSHDKALPLSIDYEGGKEKHFTFSLSPIIDGDGFARGVICTSICEISDELEARKKLEVSDTRYKLAIEAGEMGNFEWDMHEGEFNYSERLAQIFGHAHTGNLTHSDFIDQIHPDDVAIRLDAHKKASETGVLFYESRIVWPDGSVHWMRLNGKTLFDDNGNPIKMYGTVLDITDHKLHSQFLEEKVNERTQALIKRNRELKESEERYQRMTEEVQDYAIIMLDKDGTILNWNKGAQNIKGYAEHEIVGKNFRLFYRKEDLRNRLPELLIEQASQTGRAMNEGYRVRKDGTYFWGSITITALHDNANNIIGFSKVTRDLTERKLAEDRMRKYNAELEFQNKELEQFAYVASHDLQEPLRKIQMFTGLLEKNIRDEETANRYFSKINTTAGRMSDLIKAVLNYSRLSRNDQQFESVDLDLMLENVLIDFELLIEERHVQIFRDTLPTITAIPLQINQLFSNLIGNSIKFSENAPKIEVRAQRLSSSQIPFEQANLAKGTYLELVFSDNGIGFEQKYLSKIFTIFQRLNDRMSYSGTGIGLALCKKIIENHSGFITAKSDPGKGASFYIYLPFKHEAETKTGMLN